MKDGGRWVLIALALSARPPDRLTAVVQCPDGSPPPCRPLPPRARPVPPPNSVAVLYFDNLSRDTADAYLADGLTEAVIERLGRLDRLTVKSRAVVRRYRATDDLLAAGRALGVAYLVSGEVHRTGDRLRVDVELVRAANGDRLWGERYDRTAAELQTVEGEISQAVAVAVVGRLLPRERVPLTAPLTRDTRAYDELLRGNFQLSQPRTEWNLQRALEAYEAAVRFDPAFARAYARIGLTYGRILSAPIGPFRGLPRDSLLARGLAATDLALRLDSTVSDAWIARGYLLGEHDPPMESALRAAYQRAVQLDPRNAEAHQFYGVSLYQQGHNDSALQELRRALDLEPERYIALFSLGRIEFTARRYAAALPWLDSALMVQPAAGAVLSHRAAARFLLGDTATARSDAATAARLDDVGGEALLALLEIRAGDTAAARAHVERLLRGGTPRTTSHALGAAVGLIGLGEHERAMDLLERIRPRTAGVYLFLGYPWFDAMRPSPRFQRLVEASRPR